MRVATRIGPRWLAPLRRQWALPARRHRARPRVEALEDRTLPATRVFPSADVPVFLPDLDTVRLLPGWQPLLDRLQTAAAARRNSTPSAPAAANTSGS